MKKFSILCGVCAAAAVGLAGCSGEDVADVSLGLFTFKDKGLIEGIDPELTQDGLSSQGCIFPHSRIYNIGFNIQF